MANLFCLGKIETSFLIVFVLFSQNACPYDYKFIFLSRSGSRRTWRRSHGPSGDDENYLRRWLKYEGIKNIGGGLNF